MKKKFTTVVLALLMTMMYVTSGVFAVDDSSNGWKVTFEKKTLTDNSAVVVWDPSDVESYNHSDDAVFSITLSDGKNETVEEKLISEEKKTDENKDSSHFYVYKDKADEQKSDADDETPLGYSYTVEDLDPDTEYEVTVKQVVDEENDQVVGKVTFTTKEKADEDKNIDNKPDNTSVANKKTDEPEVAKKTEKGSGNADSSKLNSGDKTMKTAAGNYTLTTGWTNSTSPTTADFTWKMDRPLSSGDRIDINGYKTTPRDNGDGTYTIGLKDFDPARQYKIPIKVIDKSGKTVSNVITHYRVPYYQLATGWTSSTSPTTAEFTWKMSHPVSNGARIDINGYKTTPRNNGDGTYTIGLKDFDPARQYKIPIKVIDKNGRTISNVIAHYRVPYYQLSTGWTNSTSLTTAEFTWKMTHPVSDGARIDINGYKTTPRNNGDGTYTIGLKDFDPARQYKIPIKVIDKNGRTISNVIYHYRVPYYNLSAGKTLSINGDKATLNWKLNRELGSGHTFYVNNRKVNPTRNSDGTYTVVVSGIQQGMSYNLPVKIVDGSGKTVSNTIYIAVDTFGSEIKPMRLSITFGETVSLTDHSDGRTTTTFRSGFTTTTDGSDGGPDEGRYHFWYNGKLYYVKWSRISNVKIASSGFDKTYSAAAATNYVNRLNISSSTGMLIWVNTYTQKEYIFTGSRNNWKLAYGPWQVTTGSPWTPTASGLGTIHQKDPYFHNLPYWSTVTTYSFHGKQSSWGLGYPESNGCVRNTNGHAEYIYYNCPVGTAVWVY